MRTTRRALTVPLANPALWAFATNVVQVHTHPRLGCQFACPVRTRRALMSTEQAVNAPRAHTMVRLSGRSAFTMGTMRIECPTASTSTPSQAVSTALTTSPGRSVWFAMVAAHSFGRASLHRKSPTRDTAMHSSRCFGVTRTSISRVSAALVVAAAALPKRDPDPQTRSAQKATRVSSVVDAPTTGKPKTAIFFVSC